MKNLLRLMFLWALCCSQSTLAVTMFCKDLHATALSEIERFVRTEGFQDAVDDSAIRNALEKELLVALNTLIKEDGKSSVVERSRLLVAASQLGLSRAVSVLLKSDVRINWRDSGKEISMTALFAAAWCEKSDIVELLIAAGASTVAKSCLPFGGSPVVECTYPLHAAVAGKDFDGGSPEIVCLIIGRRDENSRAVKEMVDSIGLRAEGYLAMVSRPTRRDALSRALKGYCRGSNRDA
jgi:hypothetical protein